MRALRRTLLVVAMMSLVVLGVPSVAAAADEDCDPSQFQTENGFEITAYELCKNPSTNVDVAVPGAPIEFKAAGFDDNSRVAIYLQEVDCDEPDPEDCKIFLGYGYTDENGVLIFEFTIPAGLPEGEYSIVAEGLDPDGNPRTVESDAITIADDVSDGGNLPYTGSRTFRLTAIGAAIFVLGGVALVSSRRLKQSIR